MTNYDAAGYPVKDEHELSQIEIQEVTWILEMPHSVWIEVLHRLNMCAFPMVRYMPGDDAIMAQEAIGQSNKNAFEILDLIAEFSKSNADFSRMAKEMQSYS